MTQPEPSICSGSDAEAARKIRAIDVHAHYGKYIRPGSELQNSFATGNAKTVVERAGQANTDWTIVSPLSGLLPREGADAVAGNLEAARVVPQTEGLLQWVIVDPLQRGTYEQAREMLTLPRCVGIKLHPEEHGYQIREHGATLFEFAAQFDALVLVHSGDEKSHPLDFVPFADAHPNVSVILAHLGNGGAAAGDPSLQVQAVNAGRHENLFIDTSSARSILPGLIEWAVKEVGAARLLYGTDTPLYSATMQRARIDFAGISLEEKQAILRENAIELIRSRTEVDLTPAG